MSKKSEISIIPNNPEFYMKSIPVFKAAFLSKFSFVTQNEVLLEDIVHDFGVIDVSIKDREFVAVREDTVLGILTVSLHDQPHNKDNMQISTKDAFKKYGLMGIIRIMIFSKAVKYIPAKDELYIENVAVDQASRGQKIGSQLLNFADELAKSKGCSKVSLRVMYENEKAKSLYERLGFKVFSSESFKWMKKRTGYSGSYLMIKEIV